MKYYKKYIAVFVLCLTVLSGCSLPGLKIVIQMTMLELHL